MSFNAFFIVIVWEIDATNLVGTSTKVVHMHLKIATIF